MNVLLGPPVSVNVVLEIAEENTMVRVSGESPLVEAESGDVSTTMNREAVQRGPKSRERSYLYRADHAGCGDEYRHPGRRQLFDSRECRALLIFIRWMG